MKYVRLFTYDRCFVNVGSLLLSILLKISVQAEERNTPTCGCSSYTKVFTGVGSCWPLLF